MSVELRLEGRQSFSMLHREREIVPAGRINERKGTLSFELLTSVRNMEDMSVSRGAESV